MEEVDYVIEESEFETLVQTFRDTGFKWNAVARMMNVSDKKLFRWRKATGFDTKPQNVPIGNFCTK